MSLANVLVKAAADLAGMAYIPLLRRFQHSTTVAGGEGTYVTLLSILGRVRLVHPEGERNSLLH